MSRLLQERSTLQSLQSASAASRSTRARTRCEERAQHRPPRGPRSTAAERLDGARPAARSTRGSSTRRTTRRRRTTSSIAELELKNAQERGHARQGDGRVRHPRPGSSLERRQALGRGRAAAPGRPSSRSPRRSTAIVASVAVQDRDAVPANAPVLTVVNLSTFEVEITLPENYAVDVAPAARRREILYEGKEYPGHVTAISPEVKDSQVQGHGRLRRTRRPSGLRQSQRVSVRIAASRRSRTS